VEQERKKLEAAGATVSPERRTAVLGLKVREEQSRKGPQLGPFGWEKRARTEKKRGQEVPLMHCHCVINREVSLALRGERTSEYAVERRRSTQNYWRPMCTGVEEGERKR